MKVAFRPLFLVNIEAITRFSPTRQSPRRRERFQVIGKMKHHHKLTVGVMSHLGCNHPLRRNVRFLDSFSLHHKSDGKFTKVAIVTDPQLMDKTSFRLSSKTLALEVAQFYTDINMRRSFVQSVLPFKPDLVLFLGDYFDGGPYLPEDEWQESLSRFVFTRKSWGHSYVLHPWEP